MAVPVDMLLWMGESHKALSVDDELQLMAVWRGRIPILQSKHPDKFSSPS